MNKQTSPQVVIQEAIEKSGGFAAVGRRFGINRASVAAWAKSGQVPSDRAPELAAMASAAGMDITCEHICPDFPWRMAVHQILDYEKRHAANDPSAGGGTP